MDINYWLRGDEFSFKSVLDFVAIFDKVLPCGDTNRITQTPKIGR